MANNIQKFDANQIARVVQDFLQLEVKLGAMLPKELARLRDQLDGINLNGKHVRKVNYDLFFRVSHNLYQKSSLTMGELSNALSAPLSTATGMVNWMVDIGYLQRLSDPEDRRIVRVALTDKGRRLHKIIENYIGKRFEQILSRLTVEERNMLFIIIRKIASAVKDIKG